MAELGQQANINLGGYIPAPSKQPKLWQQVLAQFLGNAAQEGLHNLTSPDMTKEQQPWYKRNPNQQELASQAQVTQGQEQLDINKGVAATSKTASEANIRQGDTRLSQEANKQQMEAFTSAAQIKEAEARTQIANSQLELAKEQFKNAKTEQERDAAFKHIQILMHLNDMQFDQTLKTQEFGLKSKVATDEMTKTPLEADELKARAEYERGLGRQAGGVKLTPEEIKKQLQGMLK